MQLKYNYFLLCFLVSIMACSQKVTEDLKYLGQEPPALTPKVFAPGIVSLENESEFGSVFNKDGTAFYYGVDFNGRTEIKYIELKENQWSNPKTILSHKKYGFNDPFLSPDENRLYFISEMTLDGLEAKQDHDIWYVEKEGDQWSEPINAGPNINSERSEYYISFTQNGTMYFSSDKTTVGQKHNNFDIYYSQSIDGEFQKAIKLGDSINTSYYEADVFIAPDESYIIFCGKRPEGLGKGDLYISFKNDDGTWSKSTNMGDDINSKSHELCPFVTSDGKYFFYTRNQDIYWVSTRIITQIRERSGRK